MSRFRIMIAEDDPSIRTGLIATLESEGYEVNAAKDGAAAVRLFGKEKFDLVLLDIMMPELNGYDVCREIRKKDTRTPVIMLTAKGEEIDKVLGLELGADDYVTKPFGIHELLARVAAAIRRSVVSSDDKEKEPDRFSVGDWVVNAKTFEATNDNQIIPLTARELALLRYFHQHPGVVLTRDDLLNRVWGVDYLGTTRTLDQHIAQLRKKIEVDPASPHIIQTVHGVGYRYVNL